MRSILSTLGRIGRAAYDSAIDLQTLISLAAGAAVAPFDHRVSDWARAHTPRYRSQNTAANVDTAVLTPLHYEWIATGLATPSGDSAGNGSMIRREAWRSSGPPR